MWSVKPTMLSPLACAVNQSLLVFVILPHRQLIFGYKKTRSPCHYLSWICRELCGFRVNLVVLWTSCLWWIWVCYELFGWSLICYSSHMLFFIVNGCIRCEPCNIVNFVDFVWTLLFLWYVHQIFIASILYSIKVELT